MKNIKMLGFDVFGTLVDWRTSVARELSPFLRRHGRDDIDPGAAADAWRGLYQPAMEEVRRGRRGFVRLDIIHRENLEKMLAQFGLDPAQIDPAELHDLSFAWRRLDPWPDTVEGLTRLKTNFAIVAMSNGNIALMMNLARHAKLPFDAILGAEPTRSYKPQPETYLGSAEIAGLEPYEVGLVAAHPDDLRAARACGLAALFVPRPLEFGPDKPPHPHDDKWDVEAPTLVGIAEKLGC